ncbi:hypothetical protein CRUP_006522 [Coryphaenoides rupestris]|nr:hypothetical protein CRUP_006522 [Coryphaenoides rupestris]
MAPWQVLRARGALRTTRDRALGHGTVGGHAVAAASHHGNTGPYVPVHYSADAASGSARTFSLGASNRMSMQDLNRRLAFYMDEVQALEAANETLEMQITELLDRKSPRDLLELDRHLAVVNELHAQITDSQTAEAQTKLQLVSRFLEATNLSARLDAERGQNVHLEAYLRDLRLTEEQLRVVTLPGLARLLTSYTQERAELQAQHLQASGDISMHLECAKSSILSQQLEMFRDESLKAMIDKNQAQNNNWFNAQQIMLEERDLSLTAAFSMQLAHLQQTTNGLEQQLSAVLQATSQQAEEYQALLHIKSGLEREIEDYTVLLDINHDSASGRISGAPGSNRAPSPGLKLGSSSGSAGRLSGGSGGRISSPYGGSRLSSTGSGGKHSHSGSNDRLSSGQALRISSTAGQVRTNSTGGRVISSSDRPAGSMGSGVGASKERISVCKRAALSISAAGRERSQERNRSTQRMANNPRIQHWVTTGVGGTVDDLDDQDDILNL